MDKLPIETLCQICQYLDDTFKPSLFAFSLVNKRCRSAACASIFRTVYISVTGPVSLRQNVESCLQVLRASLSIQHVRALEIEGCMADQGHGWTPWLRAYNQHNVFSKLPYSMNNCLYLSPPAAVQADDVLWKPLANLIDQLPSLTEITYAALNVFSPCLLESLQRHQPPCRLHHFTFCLPSLITRDLSPSIDPYELKLATSPFLHSIALRHTDYETGGSRNLNEDAVMLLASGAAPNLRNVVMLRENPGDSIDLRQAFKNPPAQWPDLQKVLPHTSGVKGRLTSLDLGGCGTITGKTLRAWDKRVEFAALRTLRLRNSVEASALKYLVTSSNLLSLASLVLDVCLEYGEDFWPQEYADVVRQLFHNTPPLRALQISDDLGRLTLDAIFAKHGGSLRRLHLSPGDCTGPNRRLITAQTVCAIAEACPAIEDLMLSLRRLRGGAEEVACYRALGSFPRLQSLTLNLDCSDTSFMLNRDLDEAPNDPSFDEYDQQPFEWPGSHIQPRNGHMRDAMINSAVDETLAEAIFQTVSGSKQPGALPLEELELHVTGGGEFGSRDWFFGLNQFFQALSRSWMCRADPRGKHHVLVEELDKSQREEMETRVGPELDDDLETIFRRIWPTGTGEWWRDWRSLPLNAAQV